MRAAPHDIRESSALDTRIRDPRSTADPQVSGRDARTLAMAQGRTERGIGQRRRVWRTCDASPCRRLAARPRGTPRRASRGAWRLPRLVARPADRKGSDVDVMVPAIACDTVSRATRPLRLPAGEQVAAQARADAVTRVQAVHVIPREVVVHETVQRLTAARQLWLHRGRGPDRFVIHHVYVPFSRASIGGRPRPPGCQGWFPVTARARSLARARASGVDERLSISARCRGHRTCSGAAGAGHHRHSPRARFLARHRRSRTALGVTAFGPARGWATPPPWLDCSRRAPRGPGGRRGYAHA